MERRLAAILVADVVGYTDLMGKDEAGTLRRLRDERTSILQPLFDQHQGRLVKLMGDGLLLEFSSAVNAVECAIAWQEAAAAGDDPGRLVYRIGVNIGDVIAEDDDIYGNGVNIAARLESMAHPGGIAISNDTYRQVVAKIDAPFEDCGEHTLKNVSEPVRVYRVGGTATPSEPAAPQSAPTPEDERPSLAVLPLTNPSSDPEQRVLSDGITEDIITELSRHRSILVSGRNSSFSFRDESIDPNAIARELGVRYILDGTIRRSGERLRLTARLLDCQAGEDVWTERFDRDVVDVFDLQDEIARTVAATIAPQIQLAELKRSRALDRDAVTAYEHALKARALLFDAVRSSEVETYRQALAQAEAALDIDPRSTSALWVKATAATFSHLLGWEEDIWATLDKAIETASALIGEDSADDAGYTTRAWAYLLIGEYDRSRADYQRAFELNPNSTLNLFTMAWGMSVMGRSEEAKEYAQQAIRLSPRDLDIWLGDAYLALALAHFVESDFSASRDWAFRALQLYHLPMRAVVLIASLGHLGETEEARRVLSAFNVRQPGFIQSVVAGTRGFYEQPEHNALLMAGLRLAGVDGTGS